MTLDGVLSVLLCVTFGLALAVVCVLLAVAWAMQEGWL